MLTRSNRHGYTLGPQVPQNGAEAVDADTDTDSDPDSDSDRDGDELRMVDPVIMSGPIRSRPIPGKAPSRP